MKSVSSLRRAEKLSGKKLNAMFENREYFPTDDELRAAEAERRAKRAARKFASA